jgi:hypothetical protein
MRTGDPNQMRCCRGVALKCKPPQNRRLKTKTPLSPSVRCLPPRLLASRHPPAPDKAHRFRLSFLLVSTSPRQTRIPTLSGDFRVRSEMLGRLNQRLQELEESIENDGVSGNWR